MCQVSDCAPWLQPLCHPIAFCILRPASKTQKNLHGHLRHPTAASFTPHTIQPVFPITAFTILTAAPRLPLPITVPLSYLLTHFDVDFFPCIGPYAIPTLPQCAPAKQNFTSTQDHHLHHPDLYSVTSRPPNQNCISPNQPLHHLLLCCSPLAQQTISLHWYGVPSPMYLGSSSYL